MKITIHKGIDHIGGCITEIESKGDRIIIDLGSNLPGTEQEDFKSEQIKNITQGAKAILYTHYHGDHVGHFAEASGCQQFIGKGAREIMLCKERLINPKSVPILETFDTYEAGKALWLGRLKVTPFFCSHSAFDSYMFLIEDGENKVLHTGDFRSHGYLGNGLDKVIPAYVGQVDALITEGTMLCRAREKVYSELDLQIETIKLLTRKEGSRHFFALCSSTDIDRLATFHAACKKTGAWLVVDSYQKDVLDIFTKYAGKHSNLFIFDRVKVLGTGESFLNDILRDGFIMTIRSKQFERMQKMRYYAKDAELIYSMWKGYLDDNEKHSNPDIKRIVEAFDKYEYLHTSGHATIETLRHLIDLVQPRKKIIIIHKDKNSDISLLNLQEEEYGKVITGFDPGQNNTVEI